MGIIDFIQSACTQTAVYWGNPVNDGEGTFTYDAPIEISCRWEDRLQLVKNEIANTEFLSRATVYTLQLLQNQGMLFLGTLDDLDSGAVDDPTIQQGAYLIKITDKIPKLRSTTEFIYKAMLSEYLF